MIGLTEIDNHFVDEYIFNHRNNLSRAEIGGTDWRFSDIIAPSFKEILEISKPKSVLEIGFNIGGSALMFLSIDTLLAYHSIDILFNKKSINYLAHKFIGFGFFNYDSTTISPGNKGLFYQYDLVFIDGNHSPEYVRNDIEKALLFSPRYILLDDYKHPSHGYIETIVTEEYRDKIEVIKVFEFNQCWHGYSMALCKVKI